MKYILGWFIVFIFSLNLSAQQDLTLFQFSGIPQNNLVNPAQLPDDKLIIGLPLLSSVNSVYNNRTFTFNEGFVTSDGTLIIDPELLVNSLDDNNFLHTQVQDQWFLVGYRVKNHYFKIGISEKLSVDFSFPKSMFDFILRGNAHYLGERVSIDKLGINANHYREISLGYATEINEKWQVGGHLNILFGLANIHTESSSLGIYTDPETFDITIDGNLEVNTSGVDALQGETIDYLTNGKNLGLGIDLGVMYKANEKLELSMSLIDIGFINWKSDLKTFTNDSKTFTLTGLDIKPFIANNNLDGDSLINEVTDSLATIFSLNELEKQYTTTLTPKWYGGAKYYINSKHRLYGSFMLQFFKENIRSGISLGYELDVNKNFGLTANYSLFSGSFSNIGLGLRVRGGPVQLYIMSDSALASLNFFNFRSIHYRFGINILIGEIKEAAPKKTHLL